MLHVLYYIFLILFGVSFLLTVVFSIIGIIVDDDFLNWGLITLLITVFFLVGLVFTAPEKSNKCPKSITVEYNSKDYTLNYKIIEYSNNEQKDTVYVITPKS